MTGLSGWICNFTIALLDLDHFKHVNDLHGHNAGDQVLKIVAARMQRQLRDYDSVVRWGGEEFLLVFPHASLADAPAIGERLCTALSREPMTLDSGTALEITASIGLAFTFREPSLSPTAFIERADKALYRAKDGGRDQYVVSEEP
ncbi:MAG: GGDEF domain-containing protein [Myxococcales bacterium]|nr:GGDEF domain-containing protein [Myxococcales bacterium]